MFAQQTKARRSGSGERSFCSHQAWGFFLRVTLGWRHRVGGGGPQRAESPVEAALAMGWAEEPARPAAPGLSFQVLIPHGFQHWSLQRLTF